MKVSTRCEYFMKRYGEVEGIRLLSQAGFKVLDFGMNTYSYDYPLYTADESTFVGHYKELKKIGLAAPQVTYLMNDLKNAGFDVATDAITIDEAVKDILKCL